MKAKLEVITPAPLPPPPKTYHIYIGDRCYGKSAGADWHEYRLDGSARGIHIPDEEKKLLDALLECMQGIERIRKGCYRPKNGQYCVGTNILQLVGLE